MGKLKGAKTFIRLLQTPLDASFTSNMIGYNKKNLSNARQIYQPKSLLSGAVFHVLLLMFKVSLAILLSP